MELIGEKNARVSYDDQGRCGYVNFLGEKTVHRFYWEFGVGNPLVVIDIPTVALWEKQTNLHSTQRNNLSTSWLCMEDKAKTFGCWASLSTTL